MTEDQAATGKGKAFFDRGDQVADTSNWDFAIEMYLEGLQREPGSMERGHRPLREVSLKRKASGGKAAGLLEQMKRKGAKEPLQQMLNGEYLLAKEPGCVAYMAEVLKAAQKLQLTEVIKWIGDIMMEAQRLAAKRDKRVLWTLVEAYEQIEDYKSAVVACDMAKLLSPNDGIIHAKLSQMSEKFAIKQGRYEQGGDFTKGVKDMGKQKEQAQTDAMVQDKDFLEKQIAEARSQYEKAPLVPGKINAVVDALLKREDEAYENEAVDILTKAHADTKAYQFRMRIGDIRIKQMNRRYHKLQSAGDKDAAKEYLRKILELELAEFTERASNYPTDLSLKFEVARRQFLAGKYDDAIANFQQAARDPRKHLASLSYLGQAFARKSWYREAAETFEKALQIDLPEDRAKELRYNLGDVLEKVGDVEKEPSAKAAAYKRANDEFSQVAQIDFNYKDVRQRLETVRSKL